MVGHLDGCCTTKAYMEEFCILYQCNSIPCNCSFSGTRKQLDREHMFFFFNKALTLVIFGPEEEKCPLVIFHSFSLFSWGLPYSEFQPCLSALPGYFFLTDTSGKQIDGSILSWLARRRRIQKRRRREWLNYYRASEREIEQGEKVRRNIYIEVVSVFKADNAQS